MHTLPVAHVPHFGQLETTNSANFSTPAQGRERLTLAAPSRVPYFAEEGSFATAFFPIRFCAAEGFTIEQQGKVQRDFQLNAISFQTAAGFAVILRDGEILTGGNHEKIRCPTSSAVFRRSRTTSISLRLMGSRYSRQDGRCSTA